LAFKHCKDFCQDQQTQTPPGITNIVAIAGMSNMNDHKMPSKEYPEILLNK
jgi:hypothetical protein